MDNLFMLTEIQCGQLVVDAIVPSITSLIVNAIKILVPILLIILGMIDLMKAVTAGDEKVMKEATSKLVKRAIYAVLIFLVVAIVQTVFSTLSKNDKDGTSGASSATSCINCFISNKCTSSTSNSGAN